MNASDTRPLRLLVGSFAALIAASMLEMPVEKLSMAGTASPVVIFSRSMISKARSASACRPDRYSATIKEARSPSRSG